jgi:hypothetical protein
LAESLGEVRGEVVVHTQRGGDGLANGGVVQARVIAAIDHAVHIQS